MMGYFMEILVFYKDILGYFQGCISVIMCVSISFNLLILVSSMFSGLAFMPTTPSYIENSLGRFLFYLGSWSTLEGGVGVTLYRFHLFCSTFKTRVRNLKNSEATYQIYIHNLPVNRIKVMW